MDNQNKNIFPWAKFHNYTYFMATKYIYGKYINCGKNTELSTNKTSDLKNNEKLKRRQRCHFCMFSKADSKYSQFSINNLFFFSVNCAKG